MARRGKTSANERVGFGRPPPATRFKPGKSGNPKGRPKGSRGLTSILQESLHRKVSVNEGGKSKRFSVLQVMLRRLENDAMRGDPRAIKMLMGLFDRYAEPTEASSSRLQDVIAEDERILREYLKEPPGEVVDIPSDDGDDDDA